jgi:hypothetical protein
VEKLLEMTPRALISVPVVDLAVKHHTRELVSFGVCVLANLVANKENALWFAQFFSYCIGSLAGLFTIWSIWRHRKQPWRRRRRR